jgi:hypothetical protein
MPGVPRTPIEGNELFNLCVSINKYMGRHAQPLKIRKTGIGFTVQLPGKQLGWQTRAKLSFRK